ncbi:MAG: hypothetical protein U0992_09500 [Planctomycetaceae bacterium]
MRREAFRQLIGKRRSTCTRSTCHVAGLPMRPFIRAVSKRSALSCATTATQSTDRGGQPALAEHLPRCVPVRGLCRGHASQEQAAMEKVQAKDGWITVPDGPGLGVTLDEDFVTSVLIADRALTAVMV